MRQSPTSLFVSDVLAHWRHPFTQLIPSLTHPSLNSYCCCCRQSVTTRHCTPYTTPGTSHGIICLAEHCNAIAAHDQKPAGPTDRPTDAAMHRRLLPENLLHAIRPVEKGEVVGRGGLRLGTPPSFKKKKYTRMRHFLKKMQMTMFHRAPLWLSTSLQ